MIQDVSDEGRLSCAALAHEDADRVVGHTGRVELFELQIHSLYVELFLRVVIYAILRIV